MKWTPGPWEVGLAFGFPRIVSRVTGVLVADAIMEGGKASGRQEEVAANARLIAAAPELYEALTEIEALEFGGEPMSVAMARWIEEALKIARAALAKARGE